MGKLLLILLSLFFTFNLQAKTAFDDPKNDPNNAIGKKLKDLHDKLPNLNVTSGVCTSPNGCQEDKVAQASLAVQDPFDKKNNEAGQKTESSGSNTNAQ